MNKQDTPDRSGNKRDELSKEYIDQQLHDRIFKKLFPAGNISNLTAAERKAYEDNIGYYRDIRNVVDTARGEGREQARKEGGETQLIVIARRMLNAGVSAAQIAAFTELSAERIETLRARREDQ